ncbi:GNAT family N-acetyltransferase [Mariprofundus ferrooxydans]|nr:GNAT family N-acetyltransferase [Mariprofundus ferrooxydans]
MPKNTIRKMTRKLKMNGTVEIRTATTADLAGMTSLLGELFTIEVDFTPDVRRQRQGLAELMANDEATLLVAVIKNDIVGMCTLQPLVSTAEGGTVGMVEDLVVREAWRGRGIGGILLDAIEKVAQQQHMTRLQLLTELDNEPARRFYDKHLWENTQLIAMRKKFS